MTTNKTSHTPGPWTEAHPPYYADNGRYILGPDGHEILASYVEPKNAPLIAAAPELLEALKLIHGVRVGEAWAIEKVTDLWLFGLRYTDDYAATEKGVLNKIVDAAIAKAEGR